MYEVRGIGRMVFAAVFLMIGGVLNVIYGIAGVSRSAFFTANANYVFADLRSWGWVTLILGVLELLAAMSLFAGGEYGRWFAVLVGSLAAIGALLSIPAYPLWALAMFALSLWIVHGLVLYGQDKRAAEEAMRAPEAPPVSRQTPPVHR